MFIIRPATSSDLPQIYQFEQAYIEEIEPANLQKWLAVEVRIKEGLASGLPNMFVAEEQDKLIGHCYWDLYEDHPHIYSIFVDKAYRKNGVAAQLMAQTEQHCQAAGFTSCRLQTHHTNPAKHFFQRTGYEFIELDEDWEQYIKYF